MLPLTPFFIPLFFFLDMSGPSTGCETRLGKGDTAIKVLPHGYVCGRRIKYSSLSDMKKHAAGQAAHDFHDSLLLDLDPGYRNKIVVEGFGGFRRIVIEKGKMTIWKGFLSEKASADSSHNRVDIPLSPEDFDLVDSLVGILPEGLLGPREQFLIDPGPFFLSAYNTKQLIYGAMNSRSGMIGKPVDDLSRFCTVLRRFTQKHEEPPERGPSPKDLEELESFK